MKSFKTLSLPVVAEPMNRREYNRMLGWKLPAGGSGDDVGYYITYSDGSTRWMNKAEFEASHEPIDTPQGSNQKSEDAFQHPLWAERQRRSTPSPEGAARGVDGEERELSDAEVIELLSPFLSEMGVNPDDVVLVRQLTEDEGGKAEVCGCLTCTLIRIMKSEDEGDSWLTHTPTQVTEVGEIDIRVGSEAELQDTPRPAPNPNILTFSDALKLLKQGVAMARSGWNGKGMFVYLVGAGNYPATSRVAKSVWGSDLVPYGPYLAMKTVDGTVVPWLASQTDILAEDWGAAQP